MNKLNKRGVFLSKKEEEKKQICYPTDYPTDPKSGDYHKINLPYWGNCEDVELSILEKEKYHKDAYTWVDWAWHSDDKLPKGWIRLFYFSSFGKNKSEPTHPTNLFLYTGIEYGVEN